MELKTLPHRIEGQGSNLMQSCVGWRIRILEGSPEMSTLALDGKYLMPWPH